MQAGNEGMNSGLLQEQSGDLATEPSLWALVFILASYLNTTHSSHFPAHFNTAHIERKWGVLIAASPLSLSLTMFSLWLWTLLAAYIHTYSEAQRVTVSLFLLQAMQVRSLL